MYENKYRTKICDFTVSVQQERTSPIIIVNVAQSCLLV